MSQISTENEDNRSVAASDFVQLDQPDDLSNQEAKHQQEHPHFGLHKNALDWTMDTGTGSCPHNYENELKEHKLMIANLEVILGGEQFNLYWQLALLLQINHL
jgi:hypothetical protein